MNRRAQFKGMTHFRGHTIEETTIKFCMVRNKSTVEFKRDWGWGRLIKDSQKQHRVQRREESREGREGEDRRVY